MWTVVEDIRVMSGMVELTIFTGLLYWFFTSSRVADMLEVMSERVGGWCGAGGRDDATGASSLRRLALQQRRRHRDIYTKIDTERASRAAALFRAKESCVVPAPSPPTRPPAGLACARCAPLSRESWQGADAGGSGKFRDASVINILDIGRQTYANGGVVSRYLCDLAQCCNLQSFKYPDVVPEVVKDEQFRRAVEDTAQAELQGSGEGRKYESVKKAVEARAMKILVDISSAMSNTVLKVVAWLCHKAVRRVAGGGCGTRAVSVERLRRAAAAGLPLVFVPLHRSHLDYILVTFTLYLSGIRPPLVAAGDNLRIPLFGWFLRGCGAFYIRRRTDGSESHDDPIYKSALRSYILSSLAEKNNLEFFIEGGRTRTGKPQLPKAGILSVIMDAYLDGTIEDALLVPVTLNYDKLVDGNFVREQLGMPKQMETFWSALKGIWHMMNTNHGAIRVDFNQPFSLKELAQSFKKYSYLRSPAGAAAPLAPPNNNNDLAASLDRRILFNHSNSSLYGADVSDDHKVMVEAIGRHLVYDAASSSAIMCTDMVAYVLLCEQRRGCSLRELCSSVEARGRELGASGRDLGYSGDTLDVVCRAIEMLGPGLVRREGAEGRATVRPALTVASALELSYYANTLSAHYAPSAIVATALESIVASGGGGGGVVRHSDLMEASLELCEMLSEEFLLCAPCQRIEELVAETVDLLVSRDVLCRAEAAGGIEEERWSRRFAKTLDCEDDEEFESERTEQIKYTLGTEPHALAERRRLLLTLRPLTEAYAATGRHLAAAAQKAVIKATLDDLLASFADCTMPYGEAVSTDAIRNCLRVFKQWGVIELYTEKKERLVRILPPYDNKQAMDSACAKINKFNMESPLLRAA